MTTTITTQTVRYYNTRGNITGTETITGDAIDRNYGDIKPVAPHGLNLSAMKALATSSDPVDRVLVAQQRNITKALTQTLAQDTDLDVLWHLGVNRAVDPDTYMDGMTPEHLLIQNTLRLDKKVGETQFGVVLAAIALHRLEADLLLAIADSTNVDILMPMAAEHPHLLIRRIASANLSFRATGHSPDGLCATDDSMDDIIHMSLDVLADHLADLGIELSNVSIVQR